MKYELAGFIQAMSLDNEGPRQTFLFDANLIGCMGTEYFDGQCSNIPCPVALMEEMHTICMSKTKIKITIETA